MPSDVLIVDDDAEMREVMRLVLTTAGYSVRCAEHGQRALDVIGEHRPAVVLLDMLMPVMNGWECARELRKRYGKELPIVVVTAAESARARADEVSADDVLPKPFDVDDLLRAVGRYLPA